jgi:hypothetical protein
VYVNAGGVDGQDLFFGVAAGEASPCAFSIKLAIAQQMHYSVTNPDGTPTATIVISSDNI